MNFLVIFVLRVRKEHKCTFVPRFLSMIVGESRDGAMTKARIALLISRTILVGVSSRVLVNWDFCHVFISCQRTFVFLCMQFQVLQLTNIDKLN